MKIKSLIIDDDPFIANLFTDQLQAFKNIEIIGFAANGTEGLSKIKTLQPDLVFLDVEMPDMTGFEMLNYLEKIDFQTIFVTSFSHYAIKAIRFNALDYLTKPVDEKELKHAVNRYKLNRNTTSNQDQVKQALINWNTENLADKTLFVPLQDGELRLVLKNIVRIEGERNYSYIHLANGTQKLTSKTLAYFEDVLYDKGFYRCHKSHLVNQLFVEKMQDGTSVLLKNQQILPVSRRKKRAFLEWLMLKK